MSIDTPSLPVTNEIIQSVLNSVEETEPDAPDILLPVESVFDLPGGYISPIGEVGTDAEVRELTGRDEEAIAKANGLSKVLNTVLQRGLVRVGEVDKIDDIVLNNLLAGDRDYILLRIYAATFGKEVLMTRICPTCAKDVEVSLDLLSIPVKRLDDAHDRTFVVKCSIGEVAVELPTGHTQRELMSANEKTIAELATLLLANTVIGINGERVPGASVLDMPIRDRRKISEAVAERSPGPQMTDATAECSSCGEMLEVPLSVAALFQF